MRLLGSKINNLNRLKDLGDTVDIKIKEVEKAHKYNEDSSGIYKFKLVYRDDNRMYLLCTKGLFNDTWMSCTQYRWEAKLKYKRKTYSLENITIPTLEDVKKIKKKYLVDIIESDLIPIWLFNSVGMCLYPTNAYNVDSSGDIEQSHILFHLNAVPMIKIEY